MKALWCSLPFLVLLSSQGAEPTNVLFIADDDLRPELGCYGMEAARTPNIDRLAGQGVVSERWRATFWRKRGTGEIGYVGLYDESGDVRYDRLYPGMEKLIEDQYLGGQGGDKSAAKARFAKLDKDGDGSVTRGEFIAGVKSN